MMTVSPLLVAIATYRQRMSITWPITVSTRIQSPMRQVLSSWIWMPPQRLPSVSCSENASTPVTTADVVTMPARFTPTAVIRQMAKTMRTSAISTSAEYLRYRDRPERGANRERDGDARDADRRERPAPIRAGSPPSVASDGPGPKRSSSASPTRPASMTSTICTVPLRRSRRSQIVRSASTRAAAANRAASAVRLEIGMVIGVVRCAQCERKSESAGDAGPIGL